MSAEDIRSGPSAAKACQDIVRELETVCEDRKGYQVIYNGGILGFVPRESEINTNILRCPD